MGSAQFGAFIGSFAISLLFAVVWLLVTLLIPPIRRRPVVSYGVSMAVAFLPTFITMGGPDASNLLAAALCAALLFWQLRRAQAKLAAKAPG